MSNLIDKFDASGHIEVWKVYPDGRQELHFSDHNIITSGLGVALAYLFSGSGSANILDFQPRWFQLGSGTPAIVNASITQLTAPLNFIDYGDIFKEGHYQIKNGAIADIETFVYISQHNVRKVGPNSIQFILVVGRDAANSATLKEVGLFIHNPVGLTPIPASILMAYKTFSSVVKTSEFSIVIRWVITI